MIKLSTRSFTLCDTGDLTVELVRAVIEAYNQALREIPMPYLIHVEKRVTHSDVSFVLTFDSVKVRAEPCENGINYIFSVPRT